MPKFPGYMTDTQGDILDKTKNINPKELNVRQREMVGEAPPSISLTFSVHCITEF